MMNARIAQQYADSIKKTVAISRDTLPLQLVMLANSLSKPRVSCLEIQGEGSSIEAVLRQLFYGVLHEAKINQEKTSKRNREIALFVTQHDAIELAIAGKKQGCCGAGPL
jgi:hypothetical protein